MLYTYQLPMLLEVTGHAICGTSVGKNIHLYNLGAPSFKNHFTERKEIYVKTQLKKHTIEQNTWKVNDALQE